MFVCLYNDPSVVVVFFITPSLFLLSVTECMPYSSVCTCIIIGSSSRRRWRWYISRTVWPRITKFFTNLQTSRVYNHTGYDVTNYFRSEATAIKQSKMPPQADLGRILVPRRFASPPLGGLLVQLAAKRLETDENVNRPIWRDQIGWLWSVAMNNRI